MALDGEMVATYFKPRCLVVTSPAQQALEEPQQRRPCRSYFFVLRCLLNLASSSPFSSDIRIDNTTLPIVENVQLASKALVPYLARHSRPIQPFS